MTIVIGKDAWIIIYERGYILWTTIYHYNNNYIRIVLQYYESGYIRYFRKISILAPFFPTPKFAIFGQIDKWPTSDFGKSISDPTPGHPPSNRALTMIYKLWHSCNIQCSAGLAYTKTILALHVNPNIHLTPGFKLNCYVFSFWFYSIN